MRGPLRSQRFVAAGLILLWSGASVLLAASYSARIRDWSVMTDELQYAKLAIAIATTHSPVPTLHGTTVALANQLYPLLLAPFYGSLGSPEAFRAAHVLNAVVMTSVVFPAYLLARHLLPRPWSLAVAVLTVTVPWMVLTGFVMSEAVAYPAFVWATLAFQRTLVGPSPRRDLAAAIAIGVAILARTQFSALAVVLPLAVVGHETRRALTAADGARVGETLVSAARTSAGLHRTLWALYAAAAAAAIILVLSGYSLFGAYETTVREGSVLPAGAWWSAAEHLAVVALGCGLVPVVLGGGWLLAAVARRSSDERGAFAMLSLVTVAVLAVETASFDLRFGGDEIIRDRYLFYVVPLFLVASAAALTEERRGATAVGVAGAAALLVVAAPGLPFATFPGISVDTPVSILNETLIDESGALGTGTFVALLVLMLGVVLMIALLIAPRLPLAVILFSTVLVFSTWTLHAEVNRILSGTALSGRPLAGSPGTVLDWVDSVVPKGESAAVVSFPVSTAWGVSAIRWWDVEFWNRTVTQAYTAPDGNFTYTPFPARKLQIDAETGLIEGTEAAPAYIVGVAGDPRFGLAGVVHAENVGLRVLAAERPYRAIWSSRGISTDGWIRPDVPAAVRIHAPPAAGPVVLRARIGLRAPPSTDARYRIATETADRRGKIPAGAFAEETVFVCVTPRSPVDVTITTSTSVVADGPPLSPDARPRRRVGLLLGPVVVRRTDQTCTAD